MNKYVKVTNFTRLGQLHKEKAQSRDNLKSPFSEINRDFWQKWVHTNSRYLFAHCGFFNGQEDHVKPPSDHKNYVNRELTKMLNNTTKDKCGLKLDRSFISIFPAPTIRCIKGHIDLSEYTGNFGKLVNHPMFQKSQCTMNETNDKHVLMYFTGVTLTPAHEKDLVMM